MYKILSAQTFARNLVFACTFLQATWNPIVGEYSGIQIYLVSLILAFTFVLQIIFVKIETLPKNIRAYLLFSASIFFLVNTLSLLFNGMQPFSLDNILRIASLYLAIYVYLISFNEFQKLVTIYILGSFVNCLYLDYNFIVEGFSLSNRVSPIGQGHANAFGAELAIMALIRLSYKDLFSDKSNKFFYIFVMPTIFMTLIATFSRGALIGFLFGSLIFSLQMKPNSNWFRILYCFAISILVIKVKTFDFSVFQNRYTFSNLFDSSGREIIFNNSLDAFSTHPIIGVGIGAKLNPFFSGEASSHNLFLQILAETGLLGFLMFLLALNTLLIITHPRKSIPVLICLFAISFTDNHFLAVQFHVVLALILLALLHDQQIFIKNKMLK